MSIVSKGRVISELIFNLVPSSKKMNHCLKPFGWKVQRQWFVSVVYEYETKLKLLSEITQPSKDQLSRMSSKPWNRFSLEKLSIKWPTTWTFWKLLTCLNQLSIPGKHLQTTSEPQNVSVKGFTRGTSVLEKSNKGENLRKC